MARYFNQRQREALYINAGGKCENCGRELPEDWHADHVQPHSKGGITDVFNGQALCPDCNIKKGSMSVIRPFPHTLRGWQQEFFNRYFSKVRLDFLVMATPGSGKTIAALRAAHQLFSEGVIDSLVVVCPSDYLRTQWIEEADIAGLPLTDLTVDSWDRLILTKDFVGIVTTYHQVASKAETFLKYTRRHRTLVIGDEIHHCGEDLSWGGAYEKAFYHAVRRISLSGTPFRTDDNPIPFVDYIDTEGGKKSRADFSYGYGRALMDHGVVRPIVFPTWDGQLVWRHGFEFKQATFGDGLTEEEGRQALRTAVHPKGRWIRDVIAAADTQLNSIRNIEGHVDAAGLIVAKDTDDAEELARVVFEVTGERPKVATSKVDDAKAIIERFRSSSDKWIVAVKMVSEGVDIKRLRVGVYATTIATRVFFYQVVGRVIRWLDSLKQQTAYFYFPMYAPLVRYMKEITDEIDHVITNHEATWDVDRKASGALQIQFYQFVESEGEEADTIYLDYELDNEQINEARLLLGDLPALRNTSGAELAVILARARGIELPKRREERPEKTEKHFSTHKELTFLKKEAHACANKVAQLLVDQGKARDFQMAASIVNGAWKKINGGRGHDEMTIEQLNEKLAWLGEQYAIVSGGGQFNER